MKYRSLHPCTTDCALANGCTYPYRHRCEVCGEEYLDCNLVDGICPSCAMDEMDAERLKENEWEAGCYA